MDVLRGPRWAAGFVVLVAASVVFFGCPDKAESPDQSDAQLADAGAPDAGPPVPTELVLEISGEVADAGTTVANIPVVAGERPEIPQLQAMTVTTNLPLADYRIRIFDEADRAVPSDDVAEELPAGIVYRIRFLEPLKTGFRYALVVDAQTGPDLTDKLGRTHPDVRLEFRIAGEKEKPPPPKKKRRRRR